MIYLVEDDNCIRDLVIYTLHSAGLAAEGFGDCRVLGRLGRKTPDLVLLDLHAAGGGRHHNLKRCESPPERRSSRFCC